VVSPFALTWDDENYYLVGFDSEAGIIKHFRVDKMVDIEMTDAARDGQEAYAAIDMALYAKKEFGMFSGQEMSVQIRFENSLVGAVLDRLGRDVILVPDGENHFTVRTEVVISTQFFAWLCGFGTRAQLLAPEAAVQAMADHIRGIAGLYGTSGRGE
jgi:predicted DNA-binding transcriptional regulator YafY